MKPNDLYTVFFYYSAEERKIFIDMLFVLISNRERERERESEK